MFIGGAIIIQISLLLTQGYNKTAVRVRGRPHRLVRSAARQTLFLALANKETMNAKLCSVFILFSLCLAAAGCGPAPAKLATQTAAAPATSTPLPTLEPQYATATAAVQNGKLVQTALAGKIGFGDQGVAISSDQKLPDLALTNLLVSAKFSGPVLAAGQGWCYGFVIRYAGGAGLVLFVNSDLNWQQYQLSGTSFDLVTQGSFDAGLIAAGEVNEVRLLALGDEGQLWLNGQFVTRLDLSAVPQAGNVLVTIGEASVNTLKATGKEIQFSDFQIWSLDK